MNVLFPPGDGISLANIVACCWDSRAWGAQHDSETKVLEAALAPVMAKQVKYG